MDNKIIVAGLGWMFFNLPEPLLANEYDSGFYGKLKAGGIIMFDISTFDGIYNDGSNASETKLRRARLFLKSQKNNNWWSKLDVSLDDEQNSSEIKSAIIQYEGWDFANITIGKFKEPFSLQNVTSSKHIVSLERSLVVQALSPGRNYGISLFHEHHKKSWQLGFFKANENEDGRDTYALSSRYTHLVISQPEQLLHFGMSASARDYGGMEYEIKEQGEVHSANKVLDTSKVEVDTLYLLSVETAWIDGAYSFQSEWFKQTVNLNDSGDNNESSYTGYYVQTSYLFSDGFRTYKNGRFGRAKLNYSNAAWELMARHSEFDASEGEAIVNTWVIGANYYVNKHVRLMANFIHIISENSATKKESGNALSLRIQHDF